jgi:hypothetical protein
MAITISGTTGIAGVDGSAGTPAVQGADTNTGIFFPAADTIAFAEGGTEVMRLDSSANLKFNSGYGSVATAYGCRAWVNFDGTGTVAIRASGNVTSITDNGVGDYTVNFTTAMPDANYAWSGNIQTLNGLLTGDSTAQTTTALNVASAGATNNTKFDTAHITIAVFR